jgi:hypothetical protein
MEESQNQEASKPATDVMPVVSGAMRPTTASRVPGASPATWPKHVG